MHRQDLSLIHISSVDKGNALRILQDYFGVSREETMAFGDNTNDIGLMKAAGFSYAVENARPEVKEAARFICPSYLEKGCLLYTSAGRPGNKDGGYQDGIFPPPVIDAERKVSGGA